MGNIKNTNKYSSDEFVKRFSSLIAESGKNGVEVAEMLGASPAAGKPCRVQTHCGESRWRST